MNNLINSRLKATEKCCKEANEERKKTIKQPNEISMEKNQIADESHSANKTCYQLIHRRPWSMMLLMLMRMSGDLATETAIHTGQTGL